MVRSTSCNTCAKDIQLFLSLSPKERKAVLKVCDNKRIRSICECAHNLLKGNVHVKDKNTLHKLSKYKSILRRLTKRGESWCKKRRYLVQRGGGFLLPLLLSTVLQTVLGRS